MDLITEANGHFAVRFIAFALWGAVLLRTQGTPADASTTQTRRLVSTVLVFGLMGALLFGSLVNFGTIPLEVSRFVYTSVAGAVIVVSLAILSLKR